jgi:hypothetical protein
MGNQPIVAPSSQDEKRRSYTRPAFRIFELLQSYSSKETALGRLLERVLPRQSSVPIEELAEEIVAFSRMRAVNGKPVVIELQELAFHFRETPRHVREALLWLETMGKATKTSSRDHWKIAA